MTTARSDWHCPKCNWITDRLGLPCPTCDGVAVCENPEPFAQSGFPDFCGRRKPCSIHDHNSSERRNG